MSEEIKLPYTSKIIRAPALLDDTKIFLSHWDEGLTVDENIQKAIEENIFGRPARSYVKQFLGAFKERYIFGDERDRALRMLVRKGHDNTVINRILYYHTALADSLLYDFVAGYLYEQQSRGTAHISAREAQQYIKKLSADGKTTTPWKDTVCNRVAQGLLSTLRDFSILAGKVKKKIAPVYLPIEAFIYVAFCIGREVKSGEKIVYHQDWKLFLIDAMTVERLFLEAHQQGYLSFQTAGKLVRIEFRYTSIEGIVDAIVSRTSYPVGR